VEFSTKSITLHMKIIPKASFGNSYALIDLNVENLRTHNAYIHWKPELYTKASFLYFSL
jgi:hypothetical protein